MAVTRKAAKVKAYLSLFHGLSSFLLLYVSGDDEDRFEEDGFSLMALNPNSENVPALLPLFNVVLAFLQDTKRSKKGRKKLLVCEVVVALNLSALRGLHWSFISLCVVNLSLTLIPGHPSPRPSEVVLAPSRCTADDARLYHCCC